MLPPVGVEVARARTPLSEDQLAALTAWAEAAYGPGLVTVGSQEWLVLYRTGETEVDDPLLDEVERNAFLDR